MTLCKWYYSAKNLVDALESLSEAEEEARLIAGGTDLLLDLRQGRHPPVQTLVDISRVPELTCLEIRGERLFIGAAVPLNRIVTNNLVAEHALAVVEACRLIGGPQVRNVATLGGNVAHALPGADGTIALLSLDAYAEIWDKKGFREVPLGDLFTGPGQSALHPRGEILTGFYVPCRTSGQSSRFKRIMRPQGVALPILNAAIWVERKGDHIQDLRIAFGPSGPTPRRATTAEDILRMSRLTIENLNRAYDAMLAQLSFRTSPLRASAGYRKHLSKILFDDIITNVFS